MKKGKKNSILIFSIVGVVLLVVLLGISYALISQTLISSRKVILRAGVLELVLNEENAINITNAYPMFDEVGMIQDDVYNFKLVNNTSTDADYQLKLNKIASSNELSTSIVKYYLTKNNVGTAKLLSTIPSTSVVDSGTISSNTTINYSLRFWIDSSVTDSSLVNGKKLSYRLSIEASQ